MSPTIVSTAKSHPSSRGMFRSLRKALLSTAFISLLGSTGLAHADGWTAANIQFLYGQDNGDFKLEGGEAFPMWTFELANGWTYGDNFFFTDWNQGPNYDKKKPIGAYGELHSRLSAGKISGSTVGAGPISDLLLATEIDLPSGVTPTYCYGLGVDLKLPGFAFAFVNFFIRDEVGTKGISFQVNPVWMIPITAGPIKGSFGGWMDFMSGEGDNQDFWFQMQPTLFLDAGNFWGAPGKLNVGIEYEYFHNFLGFTELDINHPQFVLQWNI